MKCEYHNKKMCHGLHDSQKPCLNKKADDNCNMIPRKVRAWIKLDDAGKPYATMYTKPNTDTVYIVKDWIPCIVTFDKKYLPKNK